MHEIATVSLESKNWSEAVGMLSSSHLEYSQREYIHQEGIDRSFDMVSG